MSIPFKKFIPGIAWFIVVCYILFIPGHDMPEVGNWLEQMNYDKLVHMGIFGILTGLFCRPFHKADIESRKKRKYFLGIAIIGCVWGYCSELIQQYWAIGRDYELLDWVADSIGCLIAWLVSSRIFA
jgi:hypothetical protein